jgi:16S rRNA (uracil1498-N3)-methyltransferase
MAERPESTVAREWRRLLVEPQRLEACQGLVALNKPEAHYLRRVLRLRTGDPLVVVDGVGRLWTARLEQDPAAVRLDQPLDQPQFQAALPVPLLRLIVALPKLDADVTLRMACELGIDRISPVEAARSVAIDRLKPQRRETILREALEQSERLWLPQLDPDQPVRRCFAALAAPQLGCLKLLATTRHGGLPALDELLNDCCGVPPAAVAVAIGPEGGWTSEEEEAAESSGWQLVGLGTPILRCSTAAVAASTLLVSWRRRLSFGTSHQPWS